MLDLIIENGKIVSPDNVIEAAIGIKDDKIVMIGDKADMPEAKKVVDAGGNYLLPGGIDSHCHMELPFQGATSKGDFFTGTRAEAIGGTTTIIDFVTQQKGHGLMEAVEARYELTKKAAIDVAMHCIITEASEEAIAQMKEVVDFGIPSFKCYMLYKRENLMAEAGDMLAAMEEAKRQGAMFGAHAESCELTDYNVAKALKEGHREPIWHAITKNSTVEAEGINRALFLSKVAGSGYYNFHMSCKEGYEMIKEARQEGRPVYAETLTHYLTLTEDKLKEPHGERFICSPPIRSQEHLDAMWQGLADGTISTIGSDQCAYDTAQKNCNGDCFVDVPNGMCGLEFRMPVVFSEGVNKGKITLNRFVEVTSTNAAKIFGMYPQKGIIAVGSDADITIMDPDKEKIVKLEDIQIDVDYNPYEGMKVKGWPVMTIARGKIIVDNGKYLGSSGDGKYLKLKLNPEVLNHPIV